jgi:hypothetical protein
MQSLSEYIELWAFNGMLRSFEWENGGNNLEGDNPFDFFLNLLYDSRE